MRAKDAAGNVDETPAEYAWTLDSIDPKITFTEKPDAITNDRTPTLAWTIEEANPGNYSRCTLYDDTNNREIFGQYGSCPSPLDFEAELPDGDYSFSVSVEDRAYNYVSKYVYFEIDNVAPTVVSAKPTGNRVSPYASIEITFDDDVYDSKQFVKIYKRGSRTPLAIYGGRDYVDEEIEISPKKSLRRDTRYTVKVSTGVNDGANNLEVPKTWSFRTK